MPADGAKKYYWLKLHRDFFKRHDIQVIEGMDNGKDYGLFYLKLLVESIDHEGRLRFSETIPYNEQMLATITHTNIDVVRSALRLFEELGMITVMDDQTLYMEKVNEMIGCETAWAQKKREYRLSLEDKGRTSEDNVRQEIEIEKDIEIYKDKKHCVANAQKKFVKPTVEEVNAYCRERNNGINGQTFVDFYESKGWLIGKNPMKDWKAAVRTWENKNKKSTSCSGTQRKYCDNKNEDDLSDLWS